MEQYVEYVLDFLTQFGDKQSRLFGLYLASSLAVAYWLYRRRQNSGFAKFLFPESVWKHPHAWLDVKYFFFHGLLAHFLIRFLGIYGSSVALSFVAGNALDPSNLPQSSGIGSLMTALAMGGFCLVAVALVDFVAFYLHLLQHRIPLLWQFHKVHHAGEVMHPLSNFREHPVDNIVYDFTLGMIYGGVVGAFMLAFGYVPTMPTIFGIAAITFVFNMSAYSLRHSHIWLRWPGRWSMVFGSPAHHQVHHSRHPDHLDKNFAFQFPVWDVLFGTYHMPEDDRDVEFGIVEEAEGLDTCIGLYVTPFRHAWEILTRKRDAFGERPPELDSEMSELRRRTSKRNTA